MYIMCHSGRFVIDVQNVSRGRCVIDVQIVSQWHNCIFCSD